MVRAISVAVLLVAALCNKITFADEVYTKSPTYSPTHSPTYSPTNTPTDSPTDSPTAAPTAFCENEIFVNNHPDPREYTALKPESYARFGSAVATNEKVIVVGEPHRNAGGNDRGAAYIMTRQPNNEFTYQMLDSPMTKSGTQFGVAVAVSKHSDLVVVATRRGRVYVYSAYDGYYTKKTTLFDPLGGEQVHQFGSSLAIYESMSGEVTIAVGGKDREDGYVHIYRTDLNNNFALIQSIPSPIPDSNDNQFGASLALSKEFLVVGEPEYGNNDGAAWVFKLNTATMLYNTANPQQLLHAGIETGTAVATNEDATHIIVGGRGTAYSFKRISGATGPNYFSAVGVEILGNGNKYGSSLAMDGDVVVVGSWNGRGFAYAYILAGGDWALMGEPLESEPPHSGDNFSFALALCGKTLVSGVRHDDLSRTNSGSIYVFERQYDVNCAPTESPTKAPTSPPTLSPTDAPTKAPTSGKGDDITLPPTSSPTAYPTESPTKYPTESPTKYPTESPTKYPTESPTKYPTESPTKYPTESPTKYPTESPTKYPTESPTKYPTESPTKYPTESPTKYPTESPTKYPTESPTKYPTESPTKYPTESPTKYPTESPTKYPTESPTKYPTESPTKYPTESPTKYPTESPTKYPTVSPTTSPTDSPTKYPTESPTKYPTVSPTYSPTASPTKYPTVSPTYSPSAGPTKYPTLSPTSSPSTLSPTTTPTQSPTHLIEKADVYFIMDKSSSIKNLDNSCKKIVVEGEGNNHTCWFLFSLFIKKLVSVLISQNALLTWGNLRVEINAFGCEYNQKKPVHIQYQELTGVESEYEAAITAMQGESIVPRGTGTCPGQTVESVLARIEKKLLSPLEEDKDRYHIVIIVTDGVTYDGERPYIAAEALHRRDVVVYGLGIFGEYLNSNTDRKNKEMQAEQIVRFAGSKDRAFQVGNFAISFVANHIVDNMRQSALPKPQYPYTDYYNLYCHYGAHPADNYKNYHYNHIRNDQGPYWVGRSNSDLFDVCCNSMYQNPDAVQNAIDNGGSAADVPTHSEVCSWNDNYKRCRHQLTPTAAPTVKSPKELECEASPSGYSNRSKCKDIDGCESYYCRSCPSSEGSKWRCRAEETKSPTLSPEAPRYDCSVYDNAVDCANSNGFCTWFSTSNSNGYCAPGALA